MLPTPAPTYNGQPVTVEKVVNRYHVGGYGYDYRAEYLVTNPARPEAAGVLMSASELEAVLDAPAPSNDRAPAPLWSRQLHRAMGTAGIRDHAAFASRIAGRAVAHLRELTASERTAVERAVLAVEAEQYRPYAVAYVYTAAPHGALRMTPEAEALGAEIVNA